MTRLPSRPPAKWQNKTNPSASEADLMMSNFAAELKEFVGTIHMQTLEMQRGLDQPVRAYADCIKKCTSISQYLTNLIEDRPLPLFVNSETKSKSLETELLAFKEWLQDEKNSALNVRSPGIPSFAESLELHIDALKGAGFFEWQQQKAKAAQSGHSR